MLEKGALSDPRPDAHAYLLELRDRLTADYLRRVQPADEVAGTHTHFADGAMRCDVVDPAAYEGFLARGELSIHQIDSLLQYEAEHEQYVTAESQREFMQVFDSRIQNIARMCLDSLEPRHRRLLEHVPIGAAYVGYLYAGASPVSGDGDVILIGVGLSLLWLWCPWVRLLQGHADSVPDANVFIAALPDLAGLVLAMRPFPEFILFVQQLERADHLFHHIETQRRVWLAQCFAVLHEFGHIALGHTNRIRSGPVPLETRRQFELDADRFAAQALRDGFVETDSDSSNDNRYAAMYELLLLFLLEERAAEDEALLRTHPPAIERMRVALEVYLESVPQQAELVEQGLECARMLQTACRQLRSQRKRK